MPESFIQAGAATGSAEKDATEPKPLQTYPDRRNYRTNHIEVLRKWVKRLLILVRAAAG
jgi:hypothetical protein